MKMNFLYFFFTCAMAHAKNSTGTISAMSTRTPSMPLLAQKSKIFSIFGHNEGIGLNCFSMPPW